MTSQREVLVRGLGIGVGLGCVLAFIGQTLAPALARLPGLLLCGGDTFELVLRTRTSHGVCGDGHIVHYGLVLLVSSLVWSLVFIPPAVLLTRMLSSKPSRG